MKVSQYQFRLKYHTDSKSTVKARRLDYVREYGYNGEDVSPRGYGGFGVSGLH